MLVGHGIRFQVKDNFSSRAECNNSNPCAGIGFRDTKLINDRLGESYSFLEISFSHTCRTVEHEHQVESASTRRQASPSQAVAGRPTEFVDKMLTEAVRDFFQTSQGIYKL